MVDLAAFPGKIWPAVAPPVPLLVGQAAAAVLARRATQFTLATKNKKQKKTMPSTPTKRIKPLCSTPNYKKKKKKTLDLWPWQPTWDDGVSTGAVNQHFALRTGAPGAGGVEQTHEVAGHPETRVGCCGESESESGSRVASTLKGTTTNLFSKSGLAPE